MAKFSASVEIVAKSNLGKVANSISGSFAKISKSSKRLNATLVKNSETINRMGASAKRMGAVLTGVAATGIVIATRAGAKFQEMLQELSAITGLEGELLKRFGDQALETSKKFGISASDYLEGVKLVASAKPELLEQPKLLKAITDEALVLAKAQKLGMAESVNALTTAMNQFGIRAEDARKTINLLAAGSKLGSTELGNIAASMINVGGSASAMGLSIEETNAALQVMAKKGEVGAVAGTRLKSAILKLSDASDEFNPAIVGLGTAFRNIGKEAPDVERKLELFGREGINAGNAILELIDTYEELLETTSDTNIAYEQAAINMKTFAEASKRLGTTIQNELIKQFLKYEPMLTKLIERGTAFINNEKKMATAIKTVKVVLGGLIGVIASLTIAQIALNVAMVANPIGLIVAGVAGAVALLTAGITALIINWEKVKSFFTENPFGKLISYLNPIAIMVKAIISGLNVVSKFRDRGRVKGADELLQRNADGSYSPRADLFPELYQDAPSGIIPQEDFAANLQAKQTVDLSVHIDQDGRASIKDVKSSAPIKVATDVAIMSPVGAF